MDPTYPLVPIANFIGCLLILLPLLTCMTYSVGICAFAVWAMLFGFGQGVNSIIWKDNTNDIAPVWCDLTTHIFVATNVALPACSLAITRRLYRIISRRDMQPASQRQKYREFVFDMALCVGFPILSMIFYYFVQADRYDIIEEKGCADHWVPSGLSLLLLEVWIPLFPTISTLFYAPRIVYVYYRNRRDVDEHLSNKSAVQGGGDSYFRILALGMIDSALTLPLGILKVVADHARARAPLAFYPAGGWRALHAHWAPERISAALWRADAWAAYAVRFDQWVCPFLGVAIFLLCGLHREARAKYRRGLAAAARCVGFWRPAGPGAAAGAAADGEASTMRFGSAHVPGAEDPTMISLDTLDASQEEDATRRTAADPHDSCLTGASCDLKAKRRSRSSTASEGPRAATFDAPGPTETKVYEPPFFVERADVVHEIDLEMGARGRGLDDRTRGDGFGESDVSNRLPSF